MPETSRRRSSGLLLASEALLGLSLVFAPLALGAVQWWSMTVLFLLCLTAGVTALVARPRPVPWPVWAALGLTVYVGLQAIPLPRSIYQLLSPHMTATVDSIVGASAFRSISYDPGATFREFTRLLAYTCAFFAASRVATDSGSSRRLSMLVALGGALQVAIILGHKFVGAHDIYGFIPVTDADRPILGSFNNTNHEAAYLTLGIPVAAALSVRASRGAMRRLYLLLAAALSALVVASASRSGIAGMLVAWAAFALLVPPSRWWPGGRPEERSTAERRLRIVVAATLVVGAVAAAASWLDRTRITKLESLLHPSVLLKDTKVRSWFEAVPLIRDHLLTGVGRGAFQEIFPHYRVDPVRLTFTHIENLPLQAAIDLGVVVGALAALAWLLALLKAVRRDGSVLRMGAAAALLAITVHDFGDFSMDMAGAVGVTVAVLWGLCLPADRSSRRRSRAEEGEGASRSRVGGGLLPVRIAAAAVAILACLAGLGLGYRGDLRRDIIEVRTAQSQEGGGDPAEIEALATAAIARHPVEPWFHLIAGVEMLRQRKPVEALTDFSRALFLDKTDWPAHQAIADTLFDVGHRSQGLLEFRLAYVGSNYYWGVARALLERQPTEDDIAHFGGASPDVLRHFAAEAERLGHPEEAGIAARLAIALGADDETRRVLARSCLNDKKWQEALDAIAPVADLDAETARIRSEALDDLGREDEADQVLEAAYKMHPTPDAALNLADRYLTRKRPEDAIRLLRALPSDGLSPRQRARDHLLRSRYHQARGDIGQEIAELRTAERLQPDGTYAMLLADCYVRNGMLADAIEEYRSLERSSHRPRPDLERRIAQLKKALGKSPEVNGEGGGPSDSPDQLLKMGTDDDDTADDTTSQDDDDGL